MKQPAKIDVAVLMLFFNRPDNFQKVFDEVKKARPAKLFLYQDGARGERDVPGIEACRQIASDENIDWECEVHRSYQTKNQGCDPSEYLSQKWAFSMVDKCIVLEDDDVPSQSFFPFCKEMLDRYEHDERIGMIAGFNTDERTPDVTDASYFFTTNFSIWGWASWSRVIGKRRADYAFLDSPEAVSRLEALTEERKLRRDFLPMCRAHRAQGKAFFETIFQSQLWLQSQLSIVPVVNMISNVGVTDDSTHFAGSISTLPHGYRRIFTMGRHDLEFPLRHPRYVVEHVEYRHRVYRVMAWRNPRIKVARSLEELYLNVIHGNWRFIGRSIHNRIRKWMGKAAYR